jgi:hypothetical protein
LQFAAEKFSIGMTLQKGDVQYINSMALLYARDEFRDDEENTCIIYFTKLL